MNTHQDEISRRYELGIFGAGGVEAARTAGWFAFVLSLWARAWLSERLRVALSRPRAPLR
jgi:hypothetical protein